jgi:hypothetical protein
MRAFGIAVLVALLAAPAPAAELRVPKTGKYFFRVTPLRGFHTKTDTSGGLLLIPPASSQHAMIYVGIVSDDKFRGQGDAVAAAELAQRAAKAVGIDKLEKLESERPPQISDRAGLAFSGTIGAKPRYKRTAKIIIVRLEPGTFAQEWIVTQPGMGYVEFDMLKKALANITLTHE